MKPDSQLARMAIWLWLAITSLRLFAIDDQNPFPDVALQQRYQMLIGEVRCLVCQNLPIADSDAPLAQDLRREIHGMVEAGQSDDQIVAFLVSRYGDSILYRPPVQANTLPLWAAPFVLLAIGLIVFAWIVRQRAGEPRGLDR